MACIIPIMTDQKSLTLLQSAALNVNISDISSI